MCSLRACPRSRARSRSRPLPAARAGRRCTRYWALFDEHRRESDENRLWFWNPQALPVPDAGVRHGLEVDHPYYALGGWQNRAFAVPPAMGVDYRVVNGYIYISPNPVTDPAKIAERAEYFQKRAGHYFQNWDELYAGWRTKMEALQPRVRAIEVPDLPEYEPDEVVFGDQDLSNISLLRRLLAHAALRRDDVAAPLRVPAARYGAYLTFAEFVRSGAAGHPRPAHLPDGGRDRRGPVQRRHRAAAAGPPGDRRRRGRRLRRGPQPPRDRRRARRQRRRPRLARGARADQGPLVQHGHRRRPLPLLPQLARRPEHPLRLADRATSRRSRRARRSSGRPRSWRGERDRLAEEYGGAAGPRRSAAAFKELLGLSRTVFPYVEEHKFYCDYWFLSRLVQQGARVRRAAREARLPRGRRGRLPPVPPRGRCRRSRSCRCTWATGGPPLGRHHWPPIVARRKELLERLGEWTPPPALGRDARGGERPDHGDALGDHAGAPEGVGAAAGGAAS